MRRLCSGARAGGICRGVASRWRTSRGPESSRRRVEREGRARWEEGGGVVRERWRGAVVGWAGPSATYLAGKMGLVERLCGLGGEGPRTEWVRYRRRGLSRVSAVREV